MGLTASDASGGRRDRTRRALLNAARDALAEQGPTASVQSITDRAGVGVGSLYNHFGTKDALFAAAGADAFDEFEGWMLAGTDRLADPAERFAARVRLVAGCPTTHPVTARLAVEPAATRVRGLVNPDHALRDVHDVLASRGLTHANPEALLILASGVAMSLLVAATTSGCSDPERNAVVAEAAMLALGLAPDDATDVAHRPLPC